jgi:ribonuclease P/MRP protein subunit RPP1
VQAKTKRSSYRGIIDVVVANQPKANKRKAEDQDGESAKKGKAEAKEEQKQKHDDPPQKLSKKARKAAARAAAAAASKS